MWLRAVTWREVGGSCGRPCLYRGMGALLRARTRGGRGCAKGRRPGARGSPPSCARLARRAEGALEPVRKVLTPSLVLRLSSVVLCRVMRDIPVPGDMRQWSVSGHSGPDVSAGRRTRGGRGWRWLLAAARRATERCSPTEVRRATARIAAAPGVVARCPQARARSPLRTHPRGRTTWLRSITIGLVPRARLWPIPTPLRRAPEGAAHQDDGGTADHVRRQCPLFFRLGQWGR